MDRASKKARLRQIKIILLVFVILAIIGVPIFACFRISSGAHIALREAKNVKLAMQMLDIEYYAEDTSVYDAERPDGLKKGAKERIDDILEQDGEVLLQAYNQKSRSIQAFTYTNDHYQVVYTYDKEEGDTWKIRYFFTVMD